MRFMLLMIPGGYETAAPGTMPSAEQVAPMMAYNESLQKAGVLLSLEGLHPPSMGARISFAGGKTQLQQGPFPDVKNVLGGFWVIDVPSKDEAIDLMLKDANLLKRPVFVKGKKKLTGFNEAEVKKLLQP